MTATIPNVVNPVTNHGFSLPQYPRHGISKAKTAAPVNAIKRGARAKSSDAPIQVAANRGNPIMNTGHNVNIHAGIPRNVAWEYCQRPCVVATNSRIPPNMTAVPATKKSRRECQSRVACQKSAAMIKAHSSGRSWTSATPVIDTTIFTATWRKLALRSATVIAVDLIVIHPAREGKIPGPRFGSC
jgi:hypothetical protein